MTDSLYRKRENAPKFRQLDFASLLAAAAMK
jgi:hypothetical protein